MIRSFLRRNHLVRIALRAPARAFGPAGRQRAARSARAFCGKVNLFCLNRCGIPPKKRIFAEHRFPNPRRGFRVKRECRANRQQFPLL